MAKWAQKDLSGVPLLLLLSFLVDVASLLLTFTGIDLSFPTTDRITNASRHQILHSKDTD